MSREYYLAANYFKSIHNTSFEASSNANSDVLRQSTPVGGGALLRCIAVYEETVIQWTRKLLPSLSAANDPLQSALIKLYEAIFKPVICTVSLKSVNSGIFPDGWKATAVVPTHIPENHGDATNYR